MGENTFLTIGIVLRRLRHAQTRQKQHNHYFVKYKSRQIVARIHSVESTCTLADAATSADFGWFFAHSVEFNGVQRTFAESLILGGFLPSLWSSTEFNAHSFTPDVRNPSESALGRPGDARSSKRHFSARKRTAWKRTAPKTTPRCTARTRVRGGKGRRG